MKVAEIAKSFTQDCEAAWVSNLWTTYNNQRQSKIEEWKEQRDYIFATDTSTTSNSSLPWKNSTTLPKLCQIRDNLHSNYLSALFPNDDWVRWEAYSSEDAMRQKAEAIEAYMKNKCREGDFRNTMSSLLYDFIDYGNAFATVDYFNRVRELPDGSMVSSYAGPKVVRISPLDIVFNPLAASFEESFKVVRSVKSTGELLAMAEDMPEHDGLREALERRELLRREGAGFTKEDFDKAVGIDSDGFGSYYEYLQGDYVEILEFYGDYHNQGSNELQRHRVITVIDRSITLSNEEMQSWFGEEPIYHVGWRKRPDNLWAMGPLENLVGMQYRIDHLENAGADAMDLAIHPPLVVAGEVEQFNWGPGEEIHIDENGSVQELGKNIGAVMAAESKISQLEERMELYAGAPREAMGVRSPGEKTAFEIQQLQNASGRIFQEKITSFEIELLEKVLNAMAESARRNVDGVEVIKVMDNELGIQNFLSITKEDITARGKVRPIGARHFAAQAQLLQNLTGVLNSPIGNMIAPHTSSKAMSSLVEDILGLERFSLFRPNVALEEQQETQTLANEAQNAVAAANAVGGPM